MWPQLVDLTKEECRKLLRRHELVAYSNLVIAFRAQGALDAEKKKILKDVGALLKVSQDRHKAEVRRAVNDEKLATIAYRLTSENSTDMWAVEGRRVIPLMRRSVPQTLYSVVADEEANKTSIENEKMPLPAQTERKRPLQTALPESNKNVQFRVPAEPCHKLSPQNNNEEVASKKRKTNVNVESSSLAQHLMMGPPKVSKLQQIYRQKSKPIVKSPVKRPHYILSTTQTGTGIQKTVKRLDGDPVNLIFDEKPPVPTPPPLPIPQVENKPIIHLEIPTTNSEYTVGKIKPIMVNTLKPLASVAPQLATVNSVTPDLSPKSIKICPARKVSPTTTPLPTKTNQPQKVIIVSNAQGTNTSSILQRTLTIPFVKTISMKNLEKVKLINNIKNVQLTSSTTTLGTVAPTQSMPKPKLITVQTKGTTINKHLNIPFIQSVQLQALQNKGAIKMVPLSAATKILTKCTTMSTSTAPVYIMSSSSTVPKVSVVSGSKSPTGDNLATLRVEPISPARDEGKGEPLVFVNKPKNDKGCVLTEILKASGVLTHDDVEQGDIESQITRLTQIPNPNATLEPTADTRHVLQNDDEQDYSDTVAELNEHKFHLPKERTKYVILQNNEASQSVILKKGTEQEIIELMGNLGPGTGMYSFKTGEEYEMATNVESDDLNMDTESFVIEMESLENNELDMPSLT